MQRKVRLNIAPELEGASANFERAFEIFMGSLKDSKNLQVRRYLAFVESDENNHDLLFQARLPPKTAKKEHGDVKGDTNVVFKGTATDVIAHMFEQNLDPEARIDEIMDQVDARNLFEGVDVLIYLNVDPADEVPVLLETLNHEFAVHAVKWHEFAESVYSQEDTMAKLRERVLDMRRDHDEFGRGQNLAYRELRDLGAEQLTGPSDSDQGFDVLGFEPEESEREKFLAGSASAVYDHRPRDLVEKDLKDTRERIADLNTPLLSGTGGTSIGRQRRQPSSSSCCPCFLTTACVTYRGLPDDCAELTALRRFRDEYVLRLSNGADWFDLYYRRSPAIVAAIDAQPDPARHYDAIYAAVRSCVDGIARGRNPWVFRRYVALVARLSAELLPDEPLDLPPLPLEIGA